MTFPATPLDVHVDLWVDDAWEDITADCLGRDLIRIARGVQSPSSRRVQPGRINLSIRNDDGRYSPRNPTSDLYGLIGRGTQLRVRVGTALVGAAQQGGSASTSLVAPSVSAADDGLLVAAWVLGAVGNLTAPGGMSGGVETDGAESTMLTARETVTAGATGTRTATSSVSDLWAAAGAVLHGDAITVEEELSDTGTTDVTLTTDVATEAGWWLVAVQSWSDDPFATAPAAPTGSGWIELARVTTRILFNQTPVMGIWVRRVLVAGAQEVTFSALPSGQTADVHARLLVVSGLTSWTVRAHGEVISWPVTWDVSGNDVWSPIEAAGPMRRLSRPGRPALGSPLLRAVVGSGIGVEQYWPMEDASGATSLGSGLSDQPGLRMLGSVSPAASSDVEGSSPLVRLGSDGIITGDFSQIASTSLLAHRSVWSTIDASAISDGTRMVDLYSVGGVYRWSVQYQTGGQLSLRGYDSTGSQLVTSGTLAGFSIDDTVLLMALDLTQDGSDVDWQLRVWEASGGVVASPISASGTFAGRALGRCAGIAIAGSGGLDGVATGHHHIGTETITGGELPEALIGHRGETAGARLIRLAAEESVQLDVRGDVSDTEMMGAQRSTTVLELMQDCADVDGGLLYEARAALGLEYRTRSDVYNQAATLALTYGSAGEVMPPIELTEDDDRVTNDSTVRRTGGGSARVALESGAMSVLDPPDGIGPYPSEVEVNAAQDLRLPDLAGWRLWLGTWDEPRWPLLRISMAALGNAGKAGLSANAELLDVRDLITIADLPVWAPPGTAELIPDGYTETLGQYVWDIVATALQPAGPWQVGVRDDDDRGHRDTAGSELETGIDADDTSISVATTVGPVWTTEAADMPIPLVVGGEVMSVTAVAGTTSPQTMTVTRSVNGVTKSHDAGTAVAVHRPAVRAL